MKSKKLLLVSLSLMSVLVSCNGNDGGAPKKETFRNVSRLQVPAVCNFVHPESDGTQTQVACLQGSFSGPVDQTMTDQTAALAGLPEARRICTSMSDLVSNAGVLGSFDNTGIACDPANVFGYCILDRPSDQNSAVMQHFTGFIYFHPGSTYVRADAERICTALTNGQGTFTPTAAP